LEVLLKQNNQLKIASEKTTLTPDSSHIPNSRGSFFSPFLKAPSFSLQVWALCLKAKKRIEIHSSDNKNIHVKKQTKYRVVTKNPV